MTAGASALATNLLGRACSGAELEELETAVGASLRGVTLVRNPSVAVEIIAYRPDLMCCGEANKPGQYPYQPARTVVTAVAGPGPLSRIRRWEGLCFGGSHERAERQSRGWQPARIWVRPGDVHHGVRASDF